MRTHGRATTQPLQWEEFGKQKEDAFEFWISAGGGLLPANAGATMCSADEVFFQGQILPLRPSSSADDGGPNRCFGTSRSSSVSRSGSSSSTRSTNVFDPPQTSSPLSGHLYAHHSPKPHHVRGGKRSTGRRSASSAPGGGVGWGIFRLGVVGAPEIELYNLKSRWRTKSSATGLGHRRSDADASSHIDDLENKAAATSRLVRLGLSCRASPGAEEPIPPGRKVMAAKKKEEGVSLRREKSLCRNKMIAWMEELSIAKVMGKRDPVMLGFCSGF